MLSNGNDYQHLVGGSSIVHTQVENDDQRLYGCEVPPSPIALNNGQRRPLIHLTKEELSKFNGSDPDLPIYVAIQGFIYDVSDNRECYLKGMGYHGLAGKDGTVSFALGTPNVYKEKFPDCEDVAEADLEQRQRNLEDWKTYFDSRQVTAF